MAGLILELDAASSGPYGTAPPGNGTSLLLTDAANGWQVMEFDAPEPEPEYQWAQSVDTEGGLPVGGKHQNREIRCKLHIAKASAALLRTALDSLGAKIGKLHREGGTLKLTLPDGTVRIYDLHRGESGFVFNKRFVNSILAEISLRFPAKPYSRGAEVDLGDNVELTLQHLVFSDSGPGGAVNALGRLVVDNDGTVDWWGLAYAVESNAEYDTTAATAALYFEAESRTPIGAAATAVGPTGATGGGSNVIRHQGITDLWQGVLSTQASGGGAHLTHIGQFSVWARVQLSSSVTRDAQFALEWGPSGAVRSRNAPADVDTLLADDWYLVDLGMVSIPTGTTSWEGNVIARVTQSGGAPATVYVDQLLLFPADYRSGTAEGSIVQAAAPVTTARDEFQQSVGALTGKTAGLGGNWVGAGSATDFQVTAAATITRAAVSDVGGYQTGRIVTLASAITTSWVQVDVKTSVMAAGTLGVVARYVDVSNFFAFGLLTSSASAATLQLVRVITGTNILLAPSTLTVAMAAADTLTVRLQVDSSGHYAGWAWPTGTRQPLEPTVWGYDANLLTGGALATGKVGVIDYQNTATAATRTYDAFAGGTYTPHPVVIGARSAEIRHDGMRRHNAAGVYVPQTVQGGYLFVPPAGTEARTIRTLVRPLYHPPRADGAWLDNRADDISARLFTTPRHLT